MHVALRAYWCRETQMSCFLSLCAANLYAREFYTSWNELQYESEWVSACMCVYEYNIETVVSLCLSSLHGKQYVTHLFFSLTTCIWHCCLFFCLCYFCCCHYYDCSWKRKILMILLLLLSCLLMTDHLSVVCFDFTSHTNLNAIKTFFLNKKKNRKNSNSDQRCPTPTLQITTIENPKQNKTKGAKTKRIYLNGTSK